MHGCTSNDNTVLIDLYRYTYQFRLFVFICINCPSAKIGLMNLQLSLLHSNDDDDDATSVPRYVKYTCHTNKKRTTSGMLYDTARYQISDVDGLTQP